MPLTFTLAPQLKVTTQTVLGSRLLRLTEAALEEAVASELVDNPALERVGDDGSYPPDPMDRDDPLAGRASFYGDDIDNTDELARIAVRDSPIDQLIAQARLLVPRADFACVAYLIHSLNEHGFLTIPRAELAQELHLSCAQVDRSIAWVQQLDPPGLGAHDVRECLHLQCRALESQGIDCHLIRAILDQAWELFTHQRWQRVATILGCRLSEVHEAVDFLRRHFYLFPLLLIPHPEEDAPALTRPDLIVRSSGPNGAHPFVVEVPGAERTRLRISPCYESVAHVPADGSEALPPREWAWVQHAVAHGHVFIRSLEQRYLTLRQLGEYLVKTQATFFAGGSLKPVTRADVAWNLGLHPSTISRAVSDKILQLPDGRLIELCALFDTSRAVKETIRTLVAGVEPLSDREIAARLQQQSFNVSRRMVAQYREELGIPCRSLRTRSQAHPTQPG